MSRGARKFISADGSIAVLGGPSISSRAHKTTANTSKEVVLSRNPDRFQFLDVGLIDRGWAVFIRGDAKVGFNVAQ